MSARASWPWWVRLPLVGLSTPGQARLSAFVCLAIAAAGAAWVARAARLAPATRGDVALEHGAIVIVLLFLPGAAWYLAAAAWLERERAGPG